MSDHVNPATKENGQIAFCIGSTTSIISRPNCGIDRAIVAITMLIEVVAYSSAPRFSFGGEGRGCCTPNLGGIASQGQRMIKRRCLGKRFPTLIASGEMSPSQMRRGHNHNHRYSLQNGRNRAKARVSAGCRRVAFPRKKRARSALTVFSSLFRKRLRLFNETSGVNLAYI